MGNATQPLQVLSMVSVLALHGLDRWTSLLAMPSLDHGEEHRLFLFHVLRQLRNPAGKELGQTVRGRRLVGMDALHLLRHLKQNGELRAVGFVEARDDVSSQFSEGPICPHLGRSRRAGEAYLELREERFQVETLLCAGLGKGNIAAAAIVKLMAMEDRKQSRKPDNDVPEALVRFR